VQPVTTSHPSLLVQMVTNSAHSFSDLNSPNGDPASMVIAPKNQWGTDFTMVAPNLLPRKDDVGGLGQFVPWKYFIHLTFPESAEDGITIDGVAPAWTFRNANGGFVCGIKEITPGFHSVASRDPICADGYGRSISDAFAYTLGGVQHPYALTASDDIDLSTCDDQADTVITLHNYGSGPVTILSQSFIGRADGEILDPAVPFIMAPGGDTVVHLRFKHLRDSSVNGYLIGHGGDCDQRLYAVHLRAGASVITTTPPPGSLFSLGFLPPTVTSHDSAFTITNTGNVPLTVNPPVFSKPEFSIVSPAFPLPIPPHGSVTVTIRYTPIVEGPSDGSVLFTVVACSDTVRLNLTGSWKRGGQIGHTPAAPIALLCPPKPADTLRVEIANLGDFPYAIFSATIVGADADEFRLLTALVNSTLAPGDTKIVEILYTPGRIGPRNAALHLVTNAILGDTLIPLNVRNDAISLQSTASAIDFGLTSACTPSPSIPFGLLNTGSVRIDHISVALGSSSIGQVTPVSFDSLAAGATANFTVGLSLTAVGTIEDSIVITVPQCNYSLTIPIRAIRAPSSISFAADTLDLGTLSPCEADRQRSIYLRNASQVLDTITLARGSGSTFSVVGFNGPLYLQPGDSAELRINFTPTGTGTFIDSVTIIDSPCGIQRTLILRASFDSTRPQLSDSAIDFGAVTVGTVARKTVWLFNKTSERRQYAPITFITGHPGVRVVRPAAAFQLAPGDSVEIEFEYLPVSAGDTLSDSARLDEAAPCLFRAIALAGRSIGAPTTMKLRWEDARGTIGRNISLQLSVEGGSAANALDTFVLKSAVRFNAGLLLPIEMRGALGLRATITDNRIISGERRVAFELRGLFPATGAIAELDATAALGAADTTALAFDGATVTRVPSGSVVPLLDTIDGMFREDGICRVGSSRFIRIDGTFKLSASRPNPASDIAIVDFETVEQGRTELSLRDMRGNIVRALINEGISPGAYEAVFDVRELPSGTYWIVLQTPTQRAEGSMVVVK
ncbi:MAG: choice-of-anchor D domain-containing protein, partial [Bacteroidota bacterium]